MIKRILLNIALATVITWIISEIWWNLWMFHGFVGAPPPLRKLIDKYYNGKGGLVDGEVGYDMESITMIVVVFPVVFVLISVFQLISSRMKFKIIDVPEQRKET